MADDDLTFNFIASTNVKSNVVKKKNKFQAKRNLKRLKAKKNNNSILSNKSIHTRNHHKQQNQSIVNTKNQTHTDNDNNLSDNEEPIEMESSDTEEPIESDNNSVDVRQIEPTPMGVEIISNRPDSINSSHEQAPQSLLKNNDADTNNSSVHPSMVSKYGTSIPAKPYGTRKNPLKQVQKNEDIQLESQYTKDILTQPLKSTSSEFIFSASMSFDSLSLSEKLTQVLVKPINSNGFGFQHPTKVQVATIPAVLATPRIDVLVKSETGSGKTLSYLLPIVQTLQSQVPRIKREDGTFAIILAPTRELCLQILETASKLVGPFVYLVPGAVVGGEKKKAEKARLRKGLPILIGTPGRLLDHLMNTSAFLYDQLQFLVLDEADRLLDMGFEKQITQILEILNQKQKQTIKRQHILVSATINNNIQRLATMTLSSPKLIDVDQIKEENTKVKVSTSDLKCTSQFSTPEQLKQHFMLVPAKSRLCALACFLRYELTKSKASADTSGQSKGSKIVVFMSTCDAVDFHSKLFQSCQWPQGQVEPTLNPASTAISSLFGPVGNVYKLHGNIPQRERMETFHEFCKISSGVLFCTDVAARGVNLPTVEWIIQYDPPTETRDYVHRVGRTARSGNQGHSLLFLLPNESGYLNYLQQQNLNLFALSFEKTMTRVKLPPSNSSSNNPKQKQRYELPHEKLQHELQYLFETTLLADTNLNALGCQAFHSFIRSYATHSHDTRHIFAVRELHFGHIAKSFGLRDPPASSKLHEIGTQAKRGSLQKRKEREEKANEIQRQRLKSKQRKKREYTQQIAEFAN